MSTRYIGTELSVFAEASNFHKYYVGLFNRWVRGDVLEVGAGLGAVTSRLLECNTERVTACEPDPDLAAALAIRLGDRADVIIGGVREVPQRMGPFDAIVYVDVIEHIEDDRAEVAAAITRLKAGGALIIAGPAHPWLYSVFDARIGHYRRYNRRMVEALIRGFPSLRMVYFAYFDCLGTALSLGNRWIGRQDRPSRRQIKFWNDAILPMSQPLDRLFGYRIGKSFVAVLQQSSTAG